MTTGLQKYDLGRVIPSAQDIVTWLLTHTTYINGILAPQIDAMIAQALDEGGSIYDAIEGIRDILDQQGVNISGFLTSVQEEVQATLNKYLDDNLNLTDIEALKAALAKVDQVAALLENDDDGIVEIGELLLWHVEEDFNQVLDLTEYVDKPELPFNKTCYCYTNGGGDNAKLTIVFPDNVGNGSSVNIEFRARGTAPAIIYDLRTASQHANEVNNTSLDATNLLVGVLTGDGELSDTAKFTRIRATCLYGKWVVEVVQFEDDTQGATTYKIIYTDTLDGTTIAEEETVAGSSYQIAGKKADYCGMVHTGWKTADGTPYAFEQNIILGESNTEAPATQGAPRTLTLYAVYAERALRRNPSNGSGGTGNYASVNADATAKPYNIAAADIPDWKELYVHVNIGVWVTNCEEGNTCRARIGSRETTFAFAETLWLTKGQGYREYSLFENVRLTRASATDPFVCPDITFQAPEVSVVPFIREIVFKAEDPT